ILIIVVLLVISFPAY
ncbi:type I toxin-antitoxin system Ibs family toxin, partial [Escherichia coli]|nr:type I toxin-antitoxin system Ibs family toxin [Escherichia coli]MCN2955006.1 type I toxin-antitoxin system Ibs family toxin [Escherichia coli]MDH7193341.1 type I toxin-antitoxin system Ibs family toxin [Escherichia coli]